MDNWAYIVAAYVLIGLSLLGYIWHLRQAERRVRCGQETRHGDS